MRRLTLFIVSLLIVTSALAMLVGCVDIDPIEGVSNLADAYANSRDNYNDIYYYQEKIYKKATPDEDGYIVHRNVNVNCFVNNKYELEKDKNFAISLHEDKYIEKIDLTSKLTNNLVAFNDILAGESRVGGDKNNIRKVLFATSGDDKTSREYVARDIDTHDFYASEYFEKYQLMNTKVMRELGELLEHKEDMNFDIEKCGIVKKSKTTDYKFKVSDSYLEDYRNAHGENSLFDGKYVWVQTIYDRIANIYVYKEENLGSTTLDYECYTFTITYVGPRVYVRDCPADDTKYEDIFSEGEFGDDILKEIA